MVFKMISSEKMTQTSNYVIVYVSNFSMHYYRLSRSFIRKKMDSGDKSKETYSRTIAYCISKVIYLNFELPSLSQIFRLADRTNTLLMLRLQHPGRKDRLTLLLHEGLQQGLALTQVSYQVEVEVFGRQVRL